MSAAPPFAFTDVLLVTAWALAAVALACAACWLAWMAVPWAERVGGAA